MNDFVVLINGKKIKNKIIQGPQLWATNLNKQLCYSNPSYPEKSLVWRSGWWSHAGGQKHRQQKQWCEQRGEETRGNIRPLPWRYHPQKQYTQFLSWLSLTPPPRSGLLISLFWSQDPYHAVYAGQPGQNTRKQAYSYANKTHFSVVVGERVFCTHLQWKSSLWGNFGDQALFLALLKFPEVFLNQECGIELPHCYFIVCWARKHTLRICLLCWVEVMLLPAFLVNK